MGQWAERSDGSWTWDPTPADPSATRIMSAYAGGSPMADYFSHAPRSSGNPVSRDVYDPDLGTDGGGRYAEPDPIPAIDPDDPVSHVDQLRDGPEHWTGSAPRYEFGTMETGPTWTVPEAPRAQTWATPSSELVACPTCGTGVHPDRLRD